MSCRSVQHNLWQDIVVGLEDSLHAVQIRLEYVTVQGEAVAASSESRRQFSAKAYGRNHAIPVSYTHLRAHET